MEYDKNHLSLNEITYMTTMSAGNAYTQTSHPLKLGMSSAAEVALYACIVSRDFSYSLIEAIMLVVLPFSTPCLVV